MSNTKKITIIWTDEDIKSISKNMNIILTKNQIGDILDNIYRYHDASLGITWDTIEYHIEEYMRTKKSNLKQSYNI
jgi:hypothetical protein